MNENSDNYGRMLRQEPADDIQSVKGRVGVLVLTAAIATACVDDSQLNLSQLSNAPPTFVEHELSMTQELVNDAPLGPGIPQPSTHCPTGPGNWFAGSGRSTATSNVFGELEQVELYCVNRDLSQLSGGIATWTDANGDTIDMTFSAQLLQGDVYMPTPNAPIVGVAHFTRGTGQWDGLTGVAFISGTQNGDGTATLIYEGKVYLPRN
jgi:hypothetical protein